MIDNLFVKYPKLKAGIPEELRILRIPFEQGKAKQEPTIEDCKTYMSIKTSIREKIERLKAAYRAHRSLMR